MQQIFNVLVVDDHPLYAEALLHVLQNNHPEWQMRQAFSAEHGLREAAQIPSVALILLDPGLPGVSGAEAAALFSHHYPLATIVAVSASDDRRQAAALFRVGVRAYVSKGLTPNRLIEIIDKVVDGTLPASTWIGPDGGSQIIHETLPELSPRQREILSLLHQGLPNKEIALRLNVAEATVKAHIAILFKTLKVSNRTQAVMVAHHYGWLSAQGETQST